MPSRFLNGKYRSLAPYVPGEQPQERQFIKLNTNESPFPPSPKVAQAVTKAQVDQLRLYSDPDCTGLRRALADTLGVGPQQVICTNGSDEILAFCFLSLCEQGAAFPDCTYGFYKVFARLFGIPAVTIPLKEDFSVDLADYRDLKQTVFLANPNAPTGMALPPEMVGELCRANPDRLVIVDEAYADFALDSCVRLLPQYDNLLVVGTFSKSRSLAGARLGFAVGSEELIADLHRIRFSFNPYNVNRLTLLAGQAALADPEYFTACRDKIIATREKTAAALRDMGYTVLDSRANFLFAKSGKLGGKELYLLLKENGILVRHFDEPRIRDFLRITIGTPEEMETLLQVLRRVETMEGKQNENIH